MRTASLANTASNTSVNLLSRSRIKNLKLSMRSPRLIRKFRACWATQAPVGLAVMPPAGTRRVACSHDEQHREPVKQQGVDAEEVGGEDAEGLGGKELSPGGSAAARCRVDVGSLRAAPWGLGPAQFHQVPVPPHPSPELTRLGQLDDALNHQPPVLNPLARPVPILW
jgi:hypothetical protein